MKNRKKLVHFIGIGGIGMSSLARWFLANNWIVSGSDLAPNKITDELKRERAHFFVGHKRTNIPENARMVVYSQAIPKDNPEIREAQGLNIPCFSYPEILGELTKIYTTIAVAGAHGKSTTTALIGLMLKNAGLDPTIIVGTELKELDGKNFRAGRGEYLALESDEWKASFLNYSPVLSVITNIDREHLDFYKNIGEIKKTFLEFIGQTKPGGAVVLNKDNLALASLGKKIEKLCRKKNLAVAWYSTKNRIAKKIQRVIKIPGEHNISNAVGAYTAAKLVGIPEKTILKTISAYAGSSRRFDYRGEFRAMSQESQVRGDTHAPSHPMSHVPVYDDYAHHPTEIKATLIAFKKKFPNRYLICVFQPHQAKRLRALFHEFVRAFDSADTVLITPFYKVAGRDEIINSQFNSPALVRAIQKKYKGKSVFYLADFRNLKNALMILATEPPACGMPENPPAPNVRPTVIVMMGAGDIVNHTDSLLDKKGGREYLKTSS